MILKPSPIRIQLLFQLNGINICILLKKQLMRDMITLFKYLGCHIGEGMGIFIAQKEESMSLPEKGLGLEDLQVSFQLCSSVKTTRKGIQASYEEKLLDCISYQPIRKVSS
uniref:Uncharacterized protein n=1 Tax=Micrurus lemniscatus lemniscatus TaxID=129467 RepID=A0A2D4JTI3_MICLE